jgi:hypothetical protein
MNLNDIGIHFKKKTNYYNNKKNTGGDKSSIGQNYLSYYEKLFLDFGYSKNSKFNFLEIGIFEGRSIATFSNYYINANIFACDIDLTPFNSSIYELKKLGFKDNVKIYKQNSLIEKENNFDNNFFNIIIDDGSHEFNHQAITFNNYFHNLKSNGIYIVEDTHSNPSFIFFKELTCIVSNSKLLNRINKYYYFYLFLYFFYFINLNDIIKHINKISEIRFIRRRIIIIKK